MVRLKLFFILPPLLFSAWAGVFPAGNEVRRFSFALTGEFVEKARQVENATRNVDEELLFQIKRRLASQAVYSLVEHEIYREFRTKIFSKVLKRPDDFLLSLEFSEKEDASGGKIATGTVNMKKLSEALSLRGIPLKYAPIHRVALLHRNLGPGVLSAVREHLARFGIVAAAEKKLPNSAPGKLENLDPETIRSVFAENGDLAALYYFEFESIPAAASQVHRDVYSVTVTAQGGVRPLVRLSVAESDFDRAREEDPSLAGFEDFFFSNLNPVSLKVSDYPRPEVEFSLEVLRPFTPGQMNLFETVLLGNADRVSGYEIRLLNSEKIVYSVDIPERGRAAFTASLRGSEVFTAKIIESNPDKTVIGGLSFNSVKRSKAEPEAFSEKDRNALQSRSEVFLAGESPLVEKENNNTVRQANEFEASRTLKAKIAQRLDQDFLHLDSEENFAGLILHIAYNRNSSFRPKVTVYGGKLEKLFDFITSDRGYQRIEFRFLPGEVRRELFFRVEDRVGYIPRETGRVVPLDYYLFVEKMN